MIESAQAIEATSDSTLSQSLCMSGTSVIWPRTYGKIDGLMVNARPMDQLIFFISPLIFVGKTYLRN